MAHTVTETGGARRGDILLVEYAAMAGVAAACRTLNNRTDWRGGMRVAPLVVPQRKKQQRTAVEKADRRTHAPVRKLGAPTTQDAQESAPPRSTPARRRVDPLLRQPRGPDGTLGFKRS